MSVSASAETASKVQVDVVNWLRDALEDPALSAADNFLAVGGHSMMAIELNNRLAEKHGVTIGLADLFRKTIGDAIASSVPSS